jgi:importin-4
MRKRVAQNSGDFWTQLPQDGREQIKAKLPELILAEPTLAAEPPIFFAVC